MFVCIYALADCVDREVRLQDGIHRSNGRVEVCQDGVWGSVCTRMLDHDDARVVCRQLGYESEGIIIHYV